MVWPKSKKKIFKKYLRKFQSGMCLKVTKTGDRTERNRRPCGGDLCHGLQGSRHKKVLGKSVPGRRNSKHKAPRRGRAELVRGGAARISVDGAE